VVLARLEHDAVVRTAALLSLTLFPFHSFADPLPVSDQNPLLSGFNPSALLPARLDAEGEWSFESTFSWANSALVETNARESLIVDAETHELRLIAQRGLTHGYALRVQLPYRQTTAGTLDGFIDDWHDLFGLPEGARPSLPQDALRIFYRRDGVSQFDARSSMQGIGDASIAIGKSLVSEDRTAMSAWFELKLPTGDAKDFSGSGSVDARVSIAAEHRFADRWEVFGQAGVTRLGKGDRLSRQQREWMWSAGAGLSARAIGNLTLTLQVDAHSAVFDSENLDFLGDAVLLSLGGSYKFSSDWELTLGVSEDIAVESSPDVTFLVGLKRTF
jgi:Protein of unknown function (DUF3187)